MSKTTTGRTTDSPNGIGQKPPVGTEFRLDELKKEYERYQDDPAEQAGIMAEIGLLHARNGEIARALKAFRQGLDDARHGGEPAATALALESLGALHARIGEYPAALEYYHECIRLLGDTGDPTIVGTTWMEMGVVYGQMEDLDRALECFQRSVGIFRTGHHHFLEVRATVNIANVLVARGEPGQALEEMLRVLLTVEALGDRTGIAEALLTTGMIHERLGGSESALDHYNRARTIARNTGNSALIARAALRAGLCTIEIGDPAEGLRVIEEAIPHADTTGDYQLRYQMHEAAAAAGEAMGEIRSAYEHLKQYVRLFEAYSRMNRDELVAELQVRFDIEQTKRERERYRDEALRLRQEVTDKNRELTELALSLVQKSELLDDLKTQLQELLTSTANGTVPDSLARPLLDELESRNVDEGWRLFEGQFEKVHQDYLKRLTERFPSLTPMELKISALTRVDLATKDIARLLNLSVRNIQNHRYRLRKKLGLSPEEHLETFLAGV